MKKIYFFISILFAGVAAKAQTTCNPNANVIIYSNYDGGTLNINVDQNIPNLKIGITTYEAVKVVIGGAFVGNVTEVRYAGYNGTNDNCLQGVSNTSIAGVAGNIDTIIIYPPAGYSNANGWPNILCNYSCSSTTNQGGCNTPDQVVYYYTNAFNGQLLFHHTQYNCWTPGTTYSVSVGGNCCIAPGTTSISQIIGKKLNVFPSPANDRINVELNGVAEEFYLSDILGNKIATGKGSLETGNLPNGVYFVQVKVAEGTLTRRIVVQH